MRLGRCRTPRYAATNLVDGTPLWIDEDFYYAKEQAENHIKA